MEQPKVEISEWGELALVESLLDDWTMEHGRYHHFHNHARNLLKRVRKALVEVTENLATEEKKHGIGLSD